MQHDEPTIVDHVISRRQTTKAFADAPLDHDLEQAVVREIISAAGWAPFHRRAAAIHLQRDGFAAVVPWRFYILDGRTCRSVRKRLLAAGDQTKVPRMLAAATTLIQVTWLPNPTKDDRDGLFDPTIANMEHIAAASAAVQNLLVAATARHIPTYWSSGGALRNPEAFGWFGIPDQEILLGSVFLFPGDLEGVESVTGKLRAERGEITGWAKWVTVD